MRIAAAIVIAALLGGAAAAAEGPSKAAASPADKVLECMRANIPPKIRIQEFELKSVDRSGGERMLRGRLYATREGDRARVMMRIEAPPDLAGASYLVRETKQGSDEMYLYLPAVRKVRRLTGASQDGKLFGTDLTYNEIKQLSNAYDGGSLKLGPPEKIETRPVHTLLMTPRAGTTSLYNKIKASVDQKTCVPLRVEFADGSGLLKTLVTDAKSLKQTGSYWFFGEAEMSDLKEGTRTRLKLSEIVSPDKLADRLFSPQTFYIGG